MTLALLTGARAAAAADKYALVVTGASGGEEYARQFETWRVMFLSTLRETWSYPDDHIVMLAERPGQNVARATRENVERAIADLRKRMTKDDQLLVLLIGHGSGDGDEARFNLVGPDLRAGEWADLLRAIPGRLVFVDTTAASAPFLHALAARGRVVLTATDSSAQQFETVFPGFFVKAFGDQAADADKNGRVSVWEAFAFASAQTRAWYEQHGRLSTEHALLDDTGAGAGRQADTPGPDGELARATYLDLHNTEVGSAAMSRLLARKAELEAEVDALRARKASMKPEDYAAALEKVLIELARVSEEIRAKSN
ncbi:MAG: hypothetical protein ACM3SQ_03965 [Betaproteobacteria bacterium]